VQSEQEDNANYYTDEDLDYYEPRQDNEINNYFSSPSESSVYDTAKHQCRKCSTLFASKNELHRHLSNTGKGRRASRPACPGTLIIKPDPVIDPQLLDEKPSNENTEDDPVANLAESLITIDTSSTFRIVQSTSPSTEMNTGYTFRNFHYAMALAKLAVHCIIDYICLNTGCSVSLIDRQFLLRNLPKVQIHKMATPINVRGIGANKHQTNEYVILPIYLPSRCAKEEVIAMTSPREIHIIN